jgi:hypothetical protein
MTDWWDLFTWKRSGRVIFGDRNLSTAKMGWISEQVHDVVIQ